MTEQWGGEELSDQKQCQDNQMINHVKIFKGVDKFELT